MSLNRPTINHRNAMNYRRALNEIKNAKTVENVLRGTEFERLREILVIDGIICYSKFLESRPIFKATMQEDEGKEY